MKQTLACWSSQEYTGEQAICNCWVLCPALESKFHFSKLPLALEPHSPDGISEFPLVISKLLLGSGMPPFSSSVQGAFFFDRVTVTFICLVSIFKLREEFDHGLDVFLDEHQSVHDVAALLKEFLRDMPDSLIPSELYTAFLSTACKHPGCIALFLHSPPITSGFVRKKGNFLLVQSPGPSTVFSMLCSISAHWFPLLRVSLQMFCSDSPTLHS